MFFKMKGIIVQKWPKWLQSQLINNDKNVKNKKMLEILNDDSFIEQPNKRCLANDFPIHIDIATKTESVKCLLNTLNELEDNYDIIMFLNGICLDGTISDKDYIYYIEKHVDIIGDIKTRKDALDFYENYLSNSDTRASDLDLDERNSNNLNSDSNKGDEKTFTTEYYQNEGGSENINKQVITEPVTDVSEDDKNEQVDVSKQNEQVDVSKQNEHVDVSKQNEQVDVSKQNEPDIVSDISSHMMKRRKSINPDEIVSYTEYDNNYEQNNTEDSQQNNTEDSQQNNKEDSQQTQLEKKYDSSEVEIPSWLENASLVMEETKNPNLEQKFTEDENKYKINTNTTIRSNGNIVLELQGILPPNVLAQLAPQRVVLPLSSNNVIMISGSKKIPKISKWYIDLDSYNEKEHFYNTRNPKSESQASRQTYSTKNPKRTNNRNIKTIHSLRKLQALKR